MNQGDRQLAVALSTRVSSVSLPLPGVALQARLDTFVAQLVESVRRANYYPFVRAHRQISPRRADPDDVLFEPLLAAILHQDAGDVDEATWLVFLSVYFGRNRRTGWRLARDVYGALGGSPWTFSSMCRAPKRFRKWLAEHQETLRAGATRCFGNHRKYESLCADSGRGTAAAFESYVDWVQAAGGHRRMFSGALGPSSGDPFDELFRSMCVASFGRTAKFDYLVMLGKLAIAPLEPGSLYLSGATGPLAGARLLLGDGLSKSDLDSRAVELARRLDLPVHVLEDALCNWQKSPARFVRFRG